MFARRRGRVAHHASRICRGFCDRDDLLVLNETRVIAARLIGERVVGGARRAALAASRAIPCGTIRDASTGLRLRGPARRLRAGDRVRFGERATRRFARELAEGMREIEFELDVPFEEFLERAGACRCRRTSSNDSARRARSAIRPSSRAFREASRRRRHRFISRRSCCERDRTTRHRNRRASRSTLVSARFGRSRAEAVERTRDARGSLRDFARRQPTDTIALARREAPNRRRRDDRRARARG